MSNKSEMIRMEGKLETILHILRVAGRDGVTNIQLSKTALRYGGYLGMLYKDGYKINKEYLGEGVYKYILVSEPKEIIERSKALDILLSEVEKAGTVNKKDLEKMIDENNILVRYRANTYKSLNRSNREV